MRARHKTHTRSPNSILQNQTKPNQTYSRLYLHHLLFPSLVFYSILVSDFGLVLPIRVSKIHSILLILDLCRAQNGSYEGHHRPILFIWHIRILQFHGQVASFDFQRPPFCAFRYQVPLLNQGTNCFFFILFFVFKIYAHFLDGLLILT
jgi:hypothetical protein